MRIPLTPAARDRAARLFSGTELELVVTELETECGAGLCPGWSAEQLDRVHFAVLKLSSGSLELFDQAVGLAKTDVRDLFLAAGFEQPGAHVRWRP